MKKRFLMSLVGVVFCGISVGMFKHAALGVDPFQTLMSGLDAITPIRFGTLYVIVNLALLSVALLLDRSKIGLATFIVNPEEDSDFYKSEMNSAMFHVSS